MVRWTGFPRSTIRYRSERPAQEGLRARIRELAGERPRWGYRRIHVLLRREGWLVNRKRIHRLYREEGLAVRRKGRRRRSQVPRPVRDPLGHPNERWSVDFVRRSPGRTRADRRAEGAPPILESRNDDPRLHDMAAPDGSLEADLERGSARGSADRGVHIRHLGACARNLSFRWAPRRFPMSLAVLAVAPRRYSADADPGLEAVAGSGRCKRVGSTDRIGLRRPTPPTAR